jgi:hypothetical protein
LASGEGGGGEVDGSWGKTSNMAARKGRDDADENVAFETSAGVEVGLQLCYRITTIVAKIVRVS